MPRTKTTFHNKHPRKADSNLSTTPFAWSWKAFMRASILVAAFLGIGVSIGMGIFPGHTLAYSPARRETAPGLSADGPLPGIRGALVTERSRHGGMDQQAMILSGALGEGLTGEVTMSVFPEPAEVLRARLEAEARRDGWERLEGWDDEVGKVEFFQRGGKVRVISIQEYPNDLRSVTIFNGALAQRRQY